MQRAFHPRWAFAACDRDHRLDAAAHIKVTHDLEVFGLKQVLKFIGDVIADFFMKMPLIAERPEIKLERLEFHTEFGRHVADFDRGKIGLARDGAEASELRTVKLNEVGLAPGILKTLQFFGGTTWHSLFLFAIWQNVNPFMVNAPSP